MNTTDYRDETPTDQLSNAAQAARDKAGDIGRKALDKVNESRASAAQGLDSAASTLHQKADNLPGGERVKSVAHSTADKLASTANYIRSHELKDLAADIGEIVRRKPGQSLLAACVAGFFVGRLMRRN